MNDDDLWGNTNSTDVSIDMANSEEMMAGSHITEFYTNEHKEQVITELLVNKVLNVPEGCYVVQKYPLDPSKKSKNLNMLSKTSNVTHTQISISSVKKIKTTIINMINNS